MSDPSVLILIVNWNSRLLVLDCLASLRQVDYPRFGVWVVDNASEDGSAPAIRERFPEVTLVESRENLGFVGGNNLGLAFARQAGYEYALLLNADTEVAPDFLRQLVAAAEADPRAGMAGPLIEYFHPRGVIWSAGGRVDSWRGDTSMIGIGQPNRGQWGEAPQTVDFVSGCALLVRLAILPTVGLLDPDFFAYYEETEWCARTRRAGYRILLVPQAKIWHKITPEVRESSPQVHYYMTRNRLLFLRRARLGFSAWAFTAFDFSRTLLSWTLKPRWRHKAVQRRAMRQAIADFLRRRWGKVTLA